MFGLVSERKYEALKIEAHEKINELSSSNFRLKNENLKQNDRIEKLESDNAALRNQLECNKNLINELQSQLEQSKKNDTPRDKKTGRFVKRK